MKTMHMSVSIAKPAEEVFATISDARTQPRWDPGLLEGRHEPDGPIRVGTRVFERRRFMGRVQENWGEIVELDAPRRYVRKGKDGPMTLTGTVTCTPGPQGTNLEWEWVLDIAGPMRLAEPLMAFMMRRAAQGILENFKLTLERS